MKSYVQRSDLAPLLDESEPLILPPAGFDFAEWTSRTEVEARDQRALVDLHRELAACAALVATSASVLNYSMRYADNDPLRYALSLRCFPSDCSALNAAISNATRIHRAASVVAALGKLVTRIGLTRAILHGNGVEGNADSAIRLRDICLDCVTLSQNLEACAIGARPEHEEHEQEQHTFFQTVERLAFIAGHGGWPCLRSDGTIEIPDWSERRRSVRLRVDLDCELLAGDGACKVRVGDVSSTGAALYGVPELAEKSEVKLMFSDGSLIDCQVVWQNESRCGVKFRHTITHEQLSAITNSAV